MSTEEIIKKAIQNCVNEDGDLYYEGYTDGNAVSYYLDKNHDINVTTNYHLTQLFNNLIAKYL